MRSILLSGIFCIVSGLAAASAQQNDPDYSISRENVILSDSSLLLLEQLRHMPNIEVGNGITFRPRNNLFEVTMRFRMQNLLAMNFDDDFTLTQTDARVKRLYRNLGILQRSQSRIDVCLRACRVLGRFGCCRC